MTHPLTSFSPAAATVNPFRHTTLGPQKMSSGPVIFLKINEEKKNKFTKYLKGSCRLCSYQHFSFKYFLKGPSVQEISP